MRELKATDKITQKMTRDGAVSENLATGEVKHISSREPETELSVSSEESAGAAADLALRAAEHHEKKSARTAEKADTQAVRDGSAARQRPSSRLQFTEALINMIKVDFGKWKLVIIESTILNL